MTWAVVLIAIIVYLSFKLYDGVYHRLRAYQADKLWLRLRQDKALLTSLHIPANEQGRLGTLVSPHGIVNLDNRDNQVERLLLAGLGGGGDTIQDLLPSPQDALPQVITTDYVMDAAPSYRRLILGRTEHETVTADLASLVHVAIGGSSGWGKSMFLRWLCWQLLKSTDEVHLALIDLEGVTLAPFANNRRVLWPLADTEADAVAVTGELAGELDRRKELYSAYSDTGVDSLYRYNEAARADGRDPLVPIVTLVDEVTSLLEDKRVESNLRTLASRARKYGLWLALASVDWKGTTLDTTIRNQIGARVHFHAMSSSQSRVLMDISGAEELDVKGRAMVTRPGEKTVILQTPLLKHSDIRGLSTGGPQNRMPVRALESPEWTDEYVVGLWERLSKKNKSEMCRALWADMGREPPAPTGGSFWGEVDQAGKRVGIWD